MFIFTAATSTFFVVNAACALVALGVGFAAGVWFLGGRQLDQTDRVDSDEALNKEMVRANERSLMASSRLKDLAAGIACDVGSHTHQVEELNATLNELTNSGEAALDVDVLDAIANIVDANSKLQEKLTVAEQQIEAQAAEIQSHETEARTDSLTGLANRRAFDDELRRRYSEWQRKNTPVTLLIMDIDHFKKFNDTHGHQAGDEVLRHVGDQLTKATRDMDLPCRYGGEEFGVIMPATVANDAKIVAERIRKSIEDSSIEFEGKVLKVTTSVGLAEVSSADDAQRLLKRADDALYVSKEAGRNCGHLNLEDYCIPITPGVAQRSNGPAFDTPLVPAKTLDAMPDEHVFGDELRRRVAESHRFNVPLSVMHLQIEDYEGIRTKFGNSVAHLTLDSVAQFVNNTLREMDLLARAEAGHFVAMLPGSSFNEAAQVGARVELALSNCTIPIGDNKLQLKVRHGIAQVEVDDTVDTLMVRAQAAMVNEPIGAGA